MQGFYNVDNLAEMKDKVFAQNLNTIMIDARSGRGRDVAEK